MSSTVCGASYVIFTVPTLPAFIVVIVSGVVISAMALFWMPVIKTSPTFREAIDGSLVIAPIVNLADSMFSS